MPITPKKEKPANTICDLSPGTCFTKTDLPYMELTYIKKNYKTNMESTPNKHPYIVLEETNDTIKCVMVETLLSHTDGKNRLYLMNPESPKYLRAAYEIKQTYPPLEHNDTNKSDFRRQYIDTSKVLTIPKTLIYEAGNVSIWGNGTQKINQKELENIKQAVENSKKDKRIQTVESQPWKRDTELYDLKKFSWQLKRQEIPIYPETMQVWNNNPINPETMQDISTKQEKSESNQETTELWGYYPNKSKHQPSSEKISELRKNIIYQEDTDIQIPKVKTNITIGLAKDELRETLHSFIGLKIKKGEYSRYQNIISKTIKNEQENIEKAIKDMKQRQFQKQTIETYLGNHLQKTKEAEAEIE